MADETTSEDGTTETTSTEETTATEKTTKTEETTEQTTTESDKTLLTDKEKPQGAPETYADFTVPEGMEINKPLLDAVQPALKEAGLSQIQAQKLMDAYSGQLQAESKAASDSYAQTQKDWVKEAKGDKEIGGDKFDESIGSAKRAIDKFGTPKLVEVLDQTGLGNHPEFIRLLTRVGKLIAEDDPGGSAGPGGSEKTAAEILYPNEKPQPGL